MLSPLHTSPQVRSTRIFLSVFTCSYEWTCWHQPPVRPLPLLLTYLGLLLFSSLTFSLVTCLHC